MIARMSKYDLVLYAGQSSDFIEKLRGLGLVDITTTGWEPSDEDRQLLLTIDNHHKAVETLKRFLEDERFVKDEQPIADGGEAFDRYMAATQQAAALRSEIARLQKTADELRPWGDFSVDTLRKLADKGVVLRYFFTSRAAYEKDIEAWSERYTIALVHEGETFDYFVVVTRPGEEVVLNAQEVKAPTMDCRQAEAQIAEARRKLAELDREFSRAALSVEAIRRHGIELKRKLEEIRVKNTAQPEADGTLVILEGWAEESDSAKVDALLAEYPNLIFLKSTPTPEDNTPVKLRNRPFAHLFEVIGAMYALPKYGTIDLTRFFAPFYMIFFGFCMAEGGYGLVIMLGGLAAVMLGRKKGSSAMKEIGMLTMLCGFSGMVFGLMSGSFFGLQLSEWEWLGSLRDHLLTPDILFPLSIGLGAVQVLFAMMINAYVTARSFGLRYALGLIGWIIVLVLTVVMFIYMKYTKQGYEIAVIGESENTARYAGMNVGAIIMRTMFLSGAISGLVGFIVASGANNTLYDGVAAGVGFTAITVAWLAQLNPFAMIGISALLAVLEKGADTLQTRMNVPASISDIITGIFLFCMLGCEFFINYRLILRGGHKEVTGA